MTRCSVCAESQKIIKKDGDLSLFECFSCGHVFKDILVEEEEQYCEEYFLEEHKNWFNNPDFQLYERINTYILELKGRSSLKVLDVGCGKGGFLKYLRKKNPDFELYGIDLINNSYPGINFIKGDIIKDDIKLDFDVICNLAAIEHVSSPQIFARKMYEMLSPVHSSTG